MEIAWKISKKIERLPQDSFLRPHIKNSELSVPAIDLNDLLTNYYQRDPLKDKGKKVRKTEIPFPYYWLWDPWKLIVDLETGLGMLMSAYR